jgi:hypothetical protein
MVSQTPSANPIAPHHASWPWGVVSILLIVATVAVMTVLTWLVLDRIGKPAHQ